MQFVMLHGIVIIVNPLKMGVGANALYTQNTNCVHFITPWRVRRVSWRDRVVCVCVCVWECNLEAKQAVCVQHH